MTAAGDREALRRRVAAAAKLAALRRTEEDGVATALARARCAVETAGQARGRCEERRGRLKLERQERRARRLDEASGRRAARAAFADDEDRAAREVLRRTDEDLRRARAAEAEAAALVERLLRALGAAVAARRTAESVEARGAVELRRLDEAAAELEQEDVAAARQHATRRNPQRR
ncbi:MAG: hypothetical protein HY905_20195 [Deltaproteobacteria bacterium]|nr:hypothetical protein [Deltaproteobacteria bacterium]